MTGDRAATAAAVGALTDFLAAREAGRPHSVGDYLEQLIADEGVGVLAQGYYGLLELCALLLPSAAAAEGRGARRAAQRDRAAPRARAVRALQFTAYGGPLSLVDLPDPSPAPGGVVVQVGATGVCRSDWHGWQGHDPDVVLPHVPGHELAGTVAAVGAGVHRWSGRATG